MLRRAALVLIGSLLLTACSDIEGGGDELQVVDDPVAATPQPSPERADDPEGTVVDTPGSATDVVADATSGTIAVAVSGQDDAEDAVLFYSLDDPGTEPEEVALEGQVAELGRADGTVVATLPDEDELVRISPERGVLGRTAVDGAPVSVATYGESRLVAASETPGITVLEDEEPVASMSGDISSADQVRAVGGAAVVLDRERSAVFEIDTEEGNIGLGQRAGQGAAQAVSDRFGRVLVTDVRSDGLLAFSVDPLMMVQRYPVHGGIYGIDYDAERDIAWVTLTERNEVVGFDVAGGEPEEIHRYDSVQQPNSVSVDEQDGRVVVASAAGEGLQVIEP